MSQPANLYRLQLIDSQIQNIHIRIEEIKETLKDTKKLTQAEIQLANADANLMEAQKKLRLAENNVHDQQHKITETEKSLYSGKIRNPKELQDLQNESVALRRFLEVLEDRQLEAMIAQEEAELEQRSAINRLDSIKEKTAEQNERLSKELSELMDIKNRLSLERKAVVQTIEKADLDLYEKLIKRKRGLAVAMIADKTCGACGTTLTPAMIQAAQSLNQIVQCHSCQRIIYPG